ncbi:hypothetical protein C5F47_05295 [Nitrosopumilus cobalaminigenes]|uniref:Uncharacterized protein n=1 Tax=Nitrosopumilus cobalaminigenes TaxID=1470066 RepID=A0A7D5R644_9ARCH|nr:hypothetical protein [Nitrosopumilus cobalaminigenes]QLH03004.1 hypothetical protein C5F47_05295 [Nitrosopumilus cobalaminigenes]
MANYRRELSKIEQKDVHSRYKIHTDDYGGIFTKDKRRKLLGLKQKQGKYHEDTADFWYDVRSSVKSGLMDLELFFEVADKNQIKDVLYDAEQKAQLDLLKQKLELNKQYELERQIPSFTRVLSVLFQKYYKSRKYKLSTGETRKYSEHVEEDDTWRAEIIEKMINTCIIYLRDHNLISSKAHERLTDEFIDMVNVEIARGTKLSLNERVKGSV